MISSQKQLDEAVALGAVPPVRRRRLPGGGRGFNTEKTTPKKRDDLITHTT